MLVNIEFIISVVNKNKDKLNLGKLVKNIYKFIYNVLFNKTNFETLFNIF